MVDYDDTVMSYATGERPHRLRLDPQPREWHYDFISVDDHLVEPPTTFTDRLPARFADRAPRVERRDGIDYWIFEDRPAPLLTTDAHQSWDASQWCVAPINFDEIRRGTWDIHARVRDMDIAGISASLNFPSTMFGFSGQRFARFDDGDLGLASLRAYNDWMYDEWYSPYPKRIIPCQVTWLRDPALAADEIRRNASRGFRAVAFTENPERLELPSLYSGEWDPFFAACEETDTVINLHVGSSSQTLVPSKDSPPQVLGALFPINAMQACLDWIFAKIPLRFPDIKIVLSEGGIGWIQMVLERFRYQQYIYVADGLGKEWANEVLTPEELLHRNFWFTSFYDPLALSQRHEIGIDRIMLESDYPHADSTWPDSQLRLQECVGSFPRAEIDKLTHENAATLYRFALDSTTALRNGEAHTRRLAGAERNHAGQ
jgi:predicted TIM-barrel fold metal-dependent hydrolase